MIRAAVAHVADDRPAAIADGGDQRGPHVAVFLALLRRCADGTVGDGDGVGRRLPQLLGRHPQREDLFQLPHIGIHRDAAGLLPAGGAAHAVAHHADGMPAGRALPYGVGVLIVSADKAHIRNAADLHTDHFPFCSSMAFRRSCPQEASISPPRLRRTVAVSPWDSSRF